MALTVTTNTLGIGVPTALKRTAELLVSADNSYPAGGYDLSAQLVGATVVKSEYVPSYDGAALRFFKIVNVSGTPKLKCYAGTNNAPGAEVAGATDLSGHTGVVVGCIFQ